MLLQGSWRRELLRPFAFYGHKTTTLWCSGPVDIGSSLPHIGGILEIRTYGAEMLWHVPPMRIRYPLMDTSDFCSWFSSLGAKVDEGAGTAAVKDVVFRLLRLSEPAVLGSLAEGLSFSEATVVLFSDEWEARTEQCKDFVCARLGLFDRRVGARKCEVRAVTATKAAAFLKANHIQGANTLGVMCFGLYEGGDLLGVLSLGRHSRQIAQNRVVLDRLCFKRGVQVVGGSQRLMRHAIVWAKSQGFDEILSFSDNRWTMGSVYESLGFDLDETSKPDYCYVKDGVRLSKQSQKKDKSGCPESMTELEWAHARGLTRIYDAGKRRWVLNLWPGEHETRIDKRSKECALLHQKGVFKHAHIRGYFPSAKSGTSVYFGSSYELRCVYLLEGDEAVRTYRRCDAFKGPERWRNPDLWVDFVDGRAEVWEIKPKDMLEHEAVKKQIEDTAAFAQSQGVAMRVWTEVDSGFKGDHEIISWARKFLETEGLDPQYAEKQKTIRKAIRERYYERNIASDKVDVWCDYCQETHTALRLTYDKNIERNGKYICERYGGHLAGKRPKDHLKATNPYAEQGMKECSCCHKIVPLTDYGVRKVSWDGLSAKCRPCTLEYKKKRYRAAKERNNLLGAVAEGLASEAELEEFDRARKER